MRPRRSSRTGHEQEIPDRAGVNGAGRVIYAAAARCEAKQDMKHFPPERTQEQLDRNRVFSIYDHWTRLECLRSLARSMRSRAMDSGSRQREKLLAFEDVLIKMHDDIGEGL